MSVSEPETCPASPEPDFQCESALERKKRELLEIGMAAFTEVFESALTQHIAQLTSHGAGGGSGKRQPGNRLTSGKPGDQLPGGQKRQLNDSDDEIDDLDDLGDGNPGDRNGNKRFKSHNRRFACPYYKHDPGKYRQERTCCGPGWQDLHRLK